MIGSRAFKSNTFIPFYGSAIFGAPIKGTHVDILVK
jgi:hypothetical protein